MNSSRETVLHRFWDCPVATKAWQWRAYLMNFLAAYRQGASTPLPTSPNPQPKSASWSGFNLLPHAPNKPTPCPSHTIDPNEVSPKLEDTTATPQPTNLQPHQPNSTAITWKHGIFVHRMPSRFKQVSQIWLLLPGPIISMQWTVRNEATFNGVHWRIKKVCCNLWLEMIDYGRIAWAKTQVDIIEYDKFPWKVNP